MVKSLKETKNQSALVVLSQHNYRRDPKLTPSQLAVKCGYIWDKVAVKWVARKYEKPPIYRMAPYRKQRKFVMFTAIHKTTNAKYIWWNYGAVDRETKCFDAAGIGIVWLESCPGVEWNSTDFHAHSAAHKPY